MTNGDARREYVVAAVLLVAVGGIVGLGAGSFLQWPWYEKGVDTALTALISITTGILFGKFTALTPGGGTPTTTTTTAEPSKVTTTTAPSGMAAPVTTIIEPGKP